ncbi:MAG: hypothetical protein AAB870_04775 [Patescibacteria group bacterium]
MIRVADKMIQPGTRYPLIVQDIPEVEIMKELVRAGLKVKNAMFRAGFQSPRMPQYGSWEIYLRQPQGKVFEGFHDATYQEFLFFLLSYWDKLASLRVLTRGALAFQGAPQIPVVTTQYGIQLLTYTPLASGPNNIELMINTPIVLRPDSLIVPEELMVH